MTVQWKTEHDVTTSLRDMGHEIRIVGVKDDLTVIRRAVEDWKPHIAFNMMEHFHELGAFDHNVVSYLELLRVPYTGCNPRGLMLARDKALSKTLLSYHRVPVPDFAVVRVGRKVRRPKRMSFPLIVKSLTQEASIGISQASVVHDDKELAERVRSSTRASAPTPSSSATSRGASCTSGSSATSGCRCCRCGSCGSRRCPRTRTTSRPSG
jgi:D-alanine-D-alanine ligase